MCGAVSVMVCYRVGETEGNGKGYFTAKKLRYSLY